MSKLTIALKYGWLLFWSWAGIDIFLDTSNIIGKHEKTIEIWFKPSIDYIEQFRILNKKIANKGRVQQMEFSGKIFPFVSTENFKSKHGRYPTRAELDELEALQKKIIYNDNQLDSISKIDGNIFLISEKSEAPKEYQSKEINWGDDYLLCSNDEEDDG